MDLDLLNDNISNNDKNILDFLYKIERNNLKRYTLNLRINILRNYGVLDDFIKYLRSKDFENFVLSNDKHSIYYFTIPNNQFKLEHYEENDKRIILSNISQILSALGYTNLYGGDTYITCYRN